MSRLFSFNEFSGLKEINAAKSAIYHDTVCPVSSKSVPRTESAPGTHTTGKRHQVHRDVDVVLLLHKYVCEVHITRDVQETAIVKTGRIPFLSFI